MNSTTVDNKEEKEIKIVKDVKLSEHVSSNIPYELLTSYLVKPLPKTVVKKVVTDKVTDPSDKPDENGVMPYKLEEREVEGESEYVEGVVLKIPKLMKNSSKEEVYNKFNIGDHILFLDRSAAPFDLYKNTVIVRPHDIIGEVNREEI